MLRSIRRLAGFLAWAIALRWLVLAVVQRFGDRRGVASEPDYPNEWGVRTIPLSPREAARARDREAAALEPREVFPGIGIVGL